VLGDDHPDTLSARTNLAQALYAVGRTDDALTAFEALLADVHRVLGDDHPHTLATRNNLAAALGRKPFIRADADKVGRNDPCHCGSGKKFKRCHG